MVADLHPVVFALGVAVGLAIGVLGMWLCRDTGREDAELENAILRHQLCIEADRKQELVKQLTAELARRENGNVS